MKQGEHWTIRFGAIRAACYSDGETCTNMAESFFSRIRRAEIGIHHRIAGPYLNAYADEMAWREDHRRYSNGGQYLALATAAAHYPVKPSVERLLAKAAQSGVVSARN